MNVCTIGYVPPPEFGHPDVFLRNLERFPTKHPLILYSDHDWPAATIRLPASPEMARDEKNKFAINNLVWVTGMRIAIRQGYDYVCYIEADSRVGCKHWDDVAFTEFFEQGPENAVIGGSMVVYNPCNGGKEAMDRWAAIVHRQVERKNFPIPTYGFKSAADNTGACVFVNGSLGIYSVDWLKQKFGFADGESVKLAQSIRPWDMEIGVRLWQDHGIDAYDRVHHMETIYSSYGDVITSEKERLDMVRSGSIVATHQVKSEADV